MSAAAKVLRKALFGLACLMVCVIALFPILWMVSVSFKPQSELLTTVPTLWPKTWVLTHYVDAWRTVPLGRGIATSLLLAGATTVVAIAAASGAAYAFTRFRFWGRSFFSTAVLATQMLPGILFLIPVFLIYLYIPDVIGLPMLGTYHGLVLIYSTFSLPVAIWALISHFALIPVSLEEAAMVDGSTRLQALRKIVLPLAAPGIGATAMIVFLSAWNEVLFTSVLAGDSITTYPLVLLEFRDQYQTQWGQLMAASVIVTAPVIVVFAAFQRKITAGLVMGGVKE